MWEMENDLTFAIDEQEDIDHERQLWGIDAQPASSPRPEHDSGLRAQLMGLQQVTMESQASQMRELQNRLHEKELENIALKAVKRKAEDEEEPIALPKKLRFTEDEDDAWHNINKSARMVRPYCGNWDTRFSDLGRKADPEKRRLDWKPMGSITIAPVTIKKLHDRGSEITIRMFWPKNHDVTTRQTRISVKKDNSYLEPTLDFKDPRETWELVEALNTYTLALHRVWPEDWTGLALQRILINYRWLSNCGKLKTVQVNLLTGFINQVFSLNAANGRDAKPPLSYKEIEDTMDEMIWTKGLDKSTNCGGRDPYASSSPTIPPPPARGHNTQPGVSTRGTTRGGRGGRGGRQGGGNNGGMPKNPTCNSFNTSAGCQHAQCRYQHACNRLKGDGKICLSTNHNADGHV